MKIEMNQASKLKSKCHTRELKTLSFHCLVPSYRHPQNLSQHLSWTGLVFKPVSSQLNTLLGLSWKLWSLTTPPHMLKKSFTTALVRALDLETVKISGFLLVRTALFLVSNLLIQTINTKSLWLIATYPFTQSLPGTLSLKGLGRPRLFRKEDTIAFSLLRPWGSPHSER